MDWLQPGSQEHRTESYGTWCQPSEENADHAVPQQTRSLQEGENSRSEVTDRTRAARENIHDDRDRCNYNFRNKPKI